MTIDLESLREVRDYFADRQDAEQLAGESFPTPNEEMRLLVTVDSVLTELTARRARDAEAVRRQDMTTNDKLADALRNLIRAGKHLRNTVVETRGVAGMDDHDVAISDSIAALAEHDAQPAPAPVQVDGARESPPLPNPQVPFIGCDPSLTDIRVLVDWYKRGATAYARAAIAALRQPVPDAVREEMVGAIAKPATGWDVAGNYGDGKWRAFRLEKQQTYLGDPKSSEMEAIAETHRLAASFSQQESRND